MIAEAMIGSLVGDYLFQNDWMAQNKKKSSFACAVHCVLWTASVLVCSWTWNPWLAAWLLATHFVLDRTGLVGRYMGWVGQAGFRDNLKPWSAIAVDNTLHFVTLLMGYKTLAYFGQ